MGALHQEAEATDNHYRALCMAAQLSAALLAADEDAQALHVFHDVLRLAAPTGFYQTILDEGSARYCYVSRTMRTAPEFPTISCPMLVT